MNRQVDWHAHLAVLTKTAGAQAEGEAAAPRHHPSAPAGSRAPHGADTPARSSDGPGADVSPEALGAAGGWRHRARVVVFAAPVVAVAAGWLAFVVGRGLS